MKTSVISDHSLNYKLNQFSASVKMNTSGQKNEKSIELNVEFTQFSAKVKSKSFESFNHQGSLLEENFLSKLQEIKSGVSDTSQTLETQSLFGDTHFWGVKQTSGRISNFVLQGAGDDLERLKAGREGILRGFREAEKVWGSKLPDISYETMAKSLEAIDEKIRELGGSVVNLST